MKDREEFHEKVNLLKRVNKAGTTSTRKSTTSLKLVVVFYDCEPQPNLVNLLNQLTEFLYIGWITDHPVPFHSFHPEPIETLQSRVQAWLDEL